MGGFQIQRTYSRNTLGSGNHLRHLVSHQAVGALQTWLADEGARSLVHCENEVPKRFQALPWGSFACAWAPGSRAIQERWGLIRDELFAIAGSMRMESMLTKEVLGALYAIELRLVMQKPEAYERFFHSMLSIGGPVLIEEHNFEFANQVAPNFSYVSLYRGLTFAKQGNFRQALTLIDRCLEQNPANIECEVSKVEL